MVGRIDDAALVAGFGSTDGDDVGAEAIGFFLAYAGDGQKLRDSFGAGDDEIVEDAVGEDHEGGFAGFGGFVFAPLAEVGFEGFLCRRVGGGGLIALGFEGGLGGFGGVA